jgi:hypothetical protein
MVGISDKEFDIIGFARKIMSEVEKIRSFERIFDDESGTSGNVPIESRINAFFRLIGLPSFVEVNDETSGKQQSGDSLKFLSPGFGVTVKSELSDKIVRNSTQQSYISPSGEDVKVNIVLSNRESELGKIYNSIGTKDSNEKMTKAICSPLDIKPNIPKRILGEGEFIPKLPPRNTPDVENKRTIFKKLLPLITSYWHPNVLPLMNEVARPFLSVEERRIDRNTVLSKPFIEEVIRIRFVNLGSAKTESEKQSTKDITDSIIELLGSDIDGNSIFEDVFGNTTDIFSEVTLLEQFIIDKFLDAIRNLARKWVKLNEQRIRILRETRPKISVKTNSGRRIFGKRVVISTVLDGTSDGEKIRKLNEAIAEEEGLLTLLPSDDNESVNAKTGTTKNITGTALQNPFTDLLNYNLSKNKEKRSNLVSQSKRNIKSIEKIRVELDMMTGEFIGLSIPDIVIVITALFLIERDQLLSLLDRDVIDVMKEDNVLKAIVEDINPDPTGAMAGVLRLEAIVIQLFSLFQKEIEMIYQRNKRGRNAQSIKKAEQSVKKTSCLITTTEGT